MQSIPAGHGDFNVNGKHVRLSHIDFLAHHIESNIVNPSQNSCQIITNTMRWNPGQA